MSADTSVNIEVPSQIDGQDSMPVSDDEIILRPHDFEASQAGAHRTQRAEDHTSGAETSMELSTVSFDAYRDVLTPSSSAVADSRTGPTGEDMSVLECTQPAATEPLVPSSMLSSPMAMTELSPSSAAAHHTSTPLDNRALGGDEETPNPSGIHPAHPHAPRPSQEASSVAHTAQSQARANGRSRKPSVKALEAQHMPFEIDLNPFPIPPAGPVKKARAAIAKKGKLAAIHAALPADPETNMGKGKRVPSGGKAGKTSVSNSTASAMNHDCDPSAPTETKELEPQAQSVAEADLDLSIAVEPRGVSQGVSGDSIAADQDQSRATRRRQVSNVASGIGSQSSHLDMSAESSQNATLETKSPKRSLRQRKSTASVNLAAPSGDDSSAGEGGTSASASPKKRRRKMVQPEVAGRRTAALRARKSSLSVAELDQDDDTEADASVELQGKDELDTTDERSSESDVYQDEIDLKGKKKATKPSVKARGKVSARSRSATHKTDEVAASQPRTPVKTSKAKPRERPPAAKVTHASPVKDRLAASAQKHSASSPAPSPTKTTHPESSPSKPTFAMQAGSQTAFRQRDATIAVAPRETMKQQAEGWSLGKLEQLVWVRVNVGKGGFWWPGDIVSLLRSERPLRVQPINNGPEGIQQYTSGFEIPVEEPSPRNMLSFRIGPRVRFGRDTFADSAKKTRQDMPTPETFDLALDKAVEIETERAFVASSGTDTEEEASGQEGPTMPKAIRKKAGQRKAAKPRRPKKQPSIESEQDILEALGVGASSQQFVDDPDEDDLLQSEDESVGFAPNSIVVAKRKPRDDVWWPARFLRYEPPPEGSDGRQPRKGGKFVVEWTTGKVESVVKECILTSSQKEYRTCKLGETRLQLPKNYAATLAEFTETLYDTFQRIIKDEYPPAAEWNKLFFKGGKARDHLAQKARYGELDLPVLDGAQQVISDWVEGKKGPRPIGCAEYETLQEVERSRYKSDVLLPMTFYLVTIHEHDFEVQARKELGSDAKEDALVLRAFALADAEFDRGSVTKAGKRIAWP